MFKNKLLVALLLTLTAPAAFAIDGIYVTGSLGRSNVSGLKSSYDSFLSGVGVTGLSSTEKNNDTAFKLMAGYQINPNFAVEGGYTDLGKFKYDATFTGGTMNVSVKANGWIFDGVGILPVNDKFSVFGKLGTIRGNMDTSVSATGPGGKAAVSANSTKWKLTYGVGASYNIDKTVSIRGEYERFLKLGDKGTTGEGDVGLFSLGVAFKF